MTYIMMMRIMIDIMMRHKMMLCLAFICFMVSCTDSEDITPSYADQNLFEPSADDKSESATIKRKFYEDYGCYLLFNDTLKTEQNGKDVYGNPIWKNELVDVGYPVIGEIGASYEYTYKYVTDTQEQRKAAQIVGDKLAKILGKGCPYSILVVDSIYAWTYDDGQRVLVPESSWSGTTPYPQYLNGTRCLAVCTWGGKVYEDEHFFDDIVLDIAYAKLSHLNQDKLKDFYSTGLPYYQVYKTDLGYPYGEDDDAARQFGFWSDYGYAFFALKSDDLRKFSDAVCTYSLDEVHEMMKDYPLVIKRFEMIRDILLSLGINLK